MYDASDNLKKMLYISCIYNVDCIAQFSHFLDMHLKTILKLAFYLKQLIIVTRLFFSNANAHFFGRHISTLCLQKK